MKALNVKARQATVVLLLLAALAPGAGPAEPAKKKKKAAEKTAAAAALPVRPEQLTFEPLHFEAPRGDAYGHTLSNGVKVFVAEDHTLPLVNVEVILRIGSYLEPDTKIGLHALTGAALRQGGTASRSAEDFDERVEFLAADIATYASSAGGYATLGCITPVLGESMDLFFELLRTPGFDPRRVEVEKNKVLEEMKQRNDDAGDILFRQWNWLLFGEGYFVGREAARSHLDAIERQDLVDFHARYWRPETMIIAVSGDVDTKDFLARLERHLADWPGAADSPAAAPWPPPEPRHQPTPGVYSVEKDIPQGKVLIGNLTKTWRDWNDADEPALRVMNHVLGGSGFTSRITQRIRSDEGLAYSAGSRLNFESFWPGSFLVSFQSKSPTVALASQIALDEIGRMRNEAISADELALAKTSLIDTFPRRFESAERIASLFAQDAYLGRDHAYWQTWRQRVEAVTAADVQRVAREYLEPEEMVFLVVGHWEDVAKGDADARATMKQFYGGRVTHLPLRDPLTLEPLETGAAEAPGAEPQP